VLPENSIKYLNKLKEGMSYASIARYFNTTRQSVRKNIHKACKFDICSQTELSELLQNVSKN